MKKFLYIIILGLFILFPFNVYAEGYVSVSPTSITIEQGSSKSFNISAYNTIGDVSISSSNSGVASVNASYWGTGMVDEKQTKTGTITVTGNSVGTATITVVVDAATFDGEDLSGQTKTITVNVIAKPKPTPDPTPSPSPTPEKPSTPSNQNNNLSKNNNLKSISIDGYELIKVDNNNYKLTVSNNVTSIKLNATAEDKKATLTGTGTKELKVGENNFEIIITSESKSQNKINVKVIRKEAFYLEDLDEILNDDNIQEADIIITSESIITKQQLQKIKETKKILSFSYINEDKKLMYSWIINGKKIKEEKDFSTTINFTNDYQKEIYKLSNYADGVYISFKNTNKLSKGIKLKLYIGDKFENESNVNIYKYNKNILESIKQNIKVKDKYIEFDIEEFSNYFITMSNISNSKQKSTINIFLISTIVEFVIIIILITWIILKDKNKKTKESII